MKKSKPRNFTITIGGEDYKAVAMEIGTSLGRSIQIEIFDLDGSVRNSRIFRWLPYLDGYELYENMSASELINLAIERLNSYRDQGDLNKVENQNTILVAMHGSGKEFDRM